MYRAIKYCISSNLTLIILKWYGEGILLFQIFISRYKLGEGSSSFSDCFFLFFFRFFFFVFFFFLV